MWFHTQTLVYYVFRILEIHEDALQQELSIVFHTQASKLFYTIFLGKDDIADIEIRYKGSIRSEPQFFAVITPHFKQLYKTQVKKDGGHEKW